MTESEILKHSQVELSMRGFRVFRNNVGMAWAGSEVMHVGSDVIIKNARAIKYGLCDGSSDRIIS